jgi:hypothetical protein
MRNLSNSSDPNRWTAIAQCCAGDAHENHFESRRGIWHIQDLDVLCLYNNHPYGENFSGRDKATDLFRVWLKQQGIDELAYATYPKEGADAGYTYAMLIKAGADRQQEIADVLTAIFVGSVKAAMAVPSAPPATSHSLTAPEARS